MINAHSTHELSDHFSLRINRHRDTLILRGTLHVEVVSSALRMPRFVQLKPVEVELSVIHHPRRRLIHIHKLLSIAGAPLPRTHELALATENCHTDAHRMELHLVLGQCPCLVGEYVMQLSKVLYDTQISHFGRLSPLLRH